MDIDSLTELTEIADTDELMLMRNLNYFKFTIATLRSEVVVEDG